MNLKDFVQKVLTDSNAGNLSVTSLEVYVYPDFLIPDAKWEVMVSSEPKEGMSKITLQPTGFICLSS